jgi:hypothetical protein
MLSTLYVRPANVTSEVEGGGNTLGLIPVSGTHPQVLNLRSSASDPQILSLRFSDPQPQILILRRSA